MTKVAASEVATFLNPTHAAVRHKSVSLFKDRLISTIRNCYFDAMGGNNCGEYACIFMKNTHDNVKCIFFGYLVTTFIVSHQIGFCSFS